AGGRAVADRDGGHVHPGRPIVAGLAPQRRLDPRMMIPRRKHMPFSRSAFVHGSLASAALGCLSAGHARAQDADALIAAAKREGRGTVYSVVDPTLMQAVVKGFKDKYGIEIELVRLTSSSLGQRLSAEVESGNVAADVVIDTDKLLVQAMTTKGF